MHTQTFTEYEIAIILKHISYFSHSQYRNVMTQITTTQADTNGNHDSGYAPSNIEEILAANTATPPASPHNQATIFVNRNVHYNKTTTKNGSTSAKNSTATPNASPKKEPSFR
jgi:hypothetical protein